MEGIFCCVVSGRSLFKDIRQLMIKTVPVRRNIERDMVISG